MIRHELLDAYVDEADDETPIVDADANRDELDLDSRTLLRSFGITIH